MPVEESKYIWKNGEMVRWQDATTHLLTHALHYGTSVFEGIRSYNTSHKGVCIFRNRDHFNRLKYSARVYRIPIKYSVEELMAACQELISCNELGNAYIRPIAYLGAGEMGPGNLAATSDVAMIAYATREHPHNEEGLKNGIDVCVSSWRRAAPGTIPAGVKAGGNYLSSRLIAIEATENGFSDGIGLSHDGTVSEGQSSNVFIVNKNCIITPPCSSSVLGGLTRESIMTLAQKLGYKIIEQSIPREMLYNAEEIFLTGTVAEIHPVKSVDRLPVGTGNYPITSKLQQAFFGLFSGETEDQWGWLDPVKKEEMR